MPFSHHVSSNADLFLPGNRLECVPKQLYRKIHLSENTLAKLAAA